MSPVKYDLQIAGDSQNRPYIASILPEKELNLGALGGKNNLMRLLWQAGLRPCPRRPALAI